MDFNGILNDSASTVASNLTASPYANGVSVSFPYATAGYSEIISNTEVSLILDRMPLLLKVESYSMIDDNHARIVSSRISHKSIEETKKFLPDNGTLCFNNSLYGIYKYKDYLYWCDSIIVEFNKEDNIKEVLDQSPIFTTINNFEDKIDNKDVTKFLEDTQFYKDFAHIALEELILPYKKNARLRKHEELDRLLI